MRVPRNLAPRTTDTPVVIAIVDDGMRITHRELEAYYSARTDCRWHIMAPEGKVIRFQFDEIDTEAKTDFVFFFNGSGTRQDQLMAVFSGSDTPPDVTTWSNEVLVWFATDGQNQGRGWQVTYRFQNP